MRHGRLVRRQGDPRVALVVFALLALAGSGYVWWLFGSLVVHRTEAPAVVAGNCDQETRRIRMEFEVGGVRYGGPVPCRAYHYGDDAKVMHDRLDPRVFSDWSLREELLWTLLLTFLVNLPAAWSLLALRNWREQEAILAKVRAR